MNWQHCRSNPGTWQSLQGTATKYNVKQGKFGDYALGDVTDVLGESVGVLYGSSKPDEDGNVKTPLPGSVCVGHLALWGALYDANKKQYKVMFNDYAHGNTPQPSPPPQAPAQARQQPIHVPVGRDATGLSIERQATVKAVCERYAGTETDMATMLDACQYFHHWIATGNIDFKVANASVDDFDAAMAEPGREPGDDDPFR